MNEHHLLRAARLADVPFAAFEDDDLVAGRAAHEALFVGLAEAFAEDLDALKLHMPEVRDRTLLLLSSQMSMAGSLDISRSMVLKLPSAWPSARWKRGAGARSSTSRRWPSA